MGKKLEEFARNYTNFIIRFRWPVIIATLLLVFAAVSGAKNLAFATDYRIFFSSQNPELTAYEEFQNIYTKNDNIFFVIQPKDGNVFTPDTADAIEKITEAGWQIPYSIRVDSVSNFQHTWANEDDLTVEDLIKDAKNTPQDELNRLEAIALTEPLLVNNTISPDAQTTGVNVVLQLPQKDLFETPKAIAKAREIVQEVRAEYPDVKIALSGLGTMNNAFSEAGMADMQTLIPAMYLAMIIVMVLAIRSITGTVATLFVVGFSAMTAMGLAGYAGVQLTPVSLTAPTVILTLAIADSIHILVSMLTLMRQGMEKLEALRESIRINMMPVFITSVTTIVGFLSLNFSDSPPFWHLGNMTAAGIAAAWFFSMTFLPAFVAVTPMKVKENKEGKGMQAIMGRFADFVIAKRTPLLWGMSVLTIILLAFVPKIQLNDEFVKYFGEELEFRQDADFAIENLAGPYIVEFSVNADGPSGVSDPVFLKKLDDFVTWMRQQPEAHHVFSYTDIIKRLNKNMHGDDDKYYRIPQDKELSAQYLLLYELSLPYGLDLNDRINIDKSATRISVTLKDISTVEIRSFTERAEAWLKESAPEYMQAKATGPTVMFSYISKRNVESMLRGNVIAVIAIAGIMMLALRHIGIGALSLIPNTIPILITFGIWAILFGKVGMAAATVTATSLGIVVDDTVHFLSKYLRARREKDMNAQEAVKYAFETVGLAIIVTTLILSVGFGLLAFSTFLVNAQMGMLTAIAIIIAMIVDFLLLPPLLMVCADCSKKNKKSDTLTPPSQTKGTSMKKTALIALALIVATTNIAVAETPEEKGYAIAKRSDESDRGFKDSVADLKMILRNSQGQSTTRTVNIKTLEVLDDNLGDKGLTVFYTPADIDGTAFLSHAKILDPDDQWLYLPALKRVKRISSVNKSGPFVGSEFAFEDISGQELGKYDYKYLRSEPCGEAAPDLTCDVVERYPKYEHSGYSKQIGWVDQKDYQARKIDFYDRKGDHMKTLLFKNYKQYNGKFWRPHTWDMVNHFTNKSTTLEFSNYQFQTGLTEKDFVKNVLTRAR